MGALLFSHFQVTNVKLINEKNPLNIAVLNIREPLKIDTSMSWGCPGNHSISN